MGKYLKNASRALALVLLLCTFNSAYGAINLQKVIYLTVGSTTTINPWSVAKTYSDLSSYSCIKTKVSSISDKTALAVNTSTTTKTRYPTLNETTGYSEGFYSTYKIEALRTGTYTVNTYVCCSKREGMFPVNYYTADIYVLYTIVVTEAPTVKSITIPSSISLTIGDSYTFSPVIYEEGASTT
jgi:hypothetical protein